MNKINTHHMAEEPWVSPQGQYASASKNVSEALGREPLSTDLVIYVIADNPVGESCHYPDSGKWLVRSPARQLIRSEPLDYFEGEE